MAAYMKIVPHINVILLILYLVSSNHVLCIASIQHFSPNEILVGVKQSCLVLKTELANNDMSTVFNKLAEQVFSAESKIIFGLMSIRSFKWPNGKSLVTTTAVENIHVIIFEKQEPDRRCLFRAADARPNPVVYSGVTETAVLTEFINVHCNTYRSHTGAVNTEGLHRRQILNSLFRVSSISDLTMGTIFEEFSRTHNPTEFHKIFKINKSDNYEKEYCTKGEHVSCSDNDAVENQDVYVKPSNIYNVQNQIRSEIPKCEKISMPSKEVFFHEYLKISRPVIIQNVTNNWLAFKKWTNEYLKNEYGKSEVHIKLTPGGEYEGVEPADLWEDYVTFKIPLEVKKQLQYPDLVVVRPATLNIKFSEFMEIVENVSMGRVNNISAYLEYSSIPQHLPELEQDIQSMPFMSGLMERDQLNIWLSDGNTLGKLHFDPYDNFLCQISGQKQVLLFEPHDNEKLYESHIPEATLSYNRSLKRFRRKTLLDSTSMVMSPVDIHKPDLKRFPLFAETHPLNCTIDEGEVLFMPAFWWHEVQSYPNVKAGRNLAVNYWYEPFLTKEFPCPECPLDINPKYRHLL